MTFTSPSLISRTVSVDVKHHVYFTSKLCSTSVLSDACEKAKNDNKRCSRKSECYEDWVPQTLCFFGKLFDSQMEAIPTLGLRECRPNWKNLKQLLYRNLVVPQARRPDMESGQSISKYFCCIKTIFFMTFNLRISVLFVAWHNFL